MSYGSLEKFRRACYPCARLSFGLTSSVYVTLLERFPRCHCAAQKCSIYGCPPYWWERIGHRYGTYA